MPSMRKVHVAPGMCDEVKGVRGVQRRMHSTARLNSESLWDYAQISSCDTTYTASLCAKRLMPITAYKIGIEGYSISI